MLSTTPPTANNAVDLPHLERLTESGIWEFYQQIKVQRPPLESSEIAETLWPFKPKQIQLDTD